MAKRDRESLQQMLLEQGKTNFVTTEAVGASILAGQYHHFEGSTVTVCLLTLRNGFTVVGQSACVNPDNFDAELGESLALDDAKQQVYRFLAFRMLDEVALPFETPVPLFLDLAPWQQRLVEEREALAKKVVKLEQFIGSDAYSRLTFEDHRLLLKQLDEMARYVATLDERIARFKEVES